MTMIEKTLSTILADCLDWMEETGADPKEAASRHPDQSKELLNLLQTAAQLKSAQKPHPSQEFRSVARTRLLNQIEAVYQSHVTNGQASRHIWRNNNQAGRQAAFQPTHKRRFAMTWMLVVGMIASLLVGGGGVAYASGDALPGDALYPAKTILQDLELVFSSDLEDINHLMEHMSLNLAEMQQLATQKRYQDIQIGLGEYQENLQALVRTRARISYEDAGSEDSLNTRLQQQLQLQTKILEGLQQQLQNQDQLQLKLQEQIQEAIQLTETGNTYGPNEGGQPEESGEPNGAGPGEPQGEQNQSEEGNSEDSGSGPGEGQPNDNPGTQEGAGPDNSGDGQGPKDDNGGSGKGPGGKP
jgi:hypothetical protein